MNEPNITPDVIHSHGITDEEFERIKTLLGREPNFTELGIFSVMWSEHCSYKSSRVHLKRLPTQGECVLQGPGENAGIVDIGGGLAAAFKIESHNHPSFIEPYQGAATGVGGILRDVFTMGARPVAAMNSLHFGPLKADNGASEEERKTIARNRSILSGVVKGIGDYGNCLVGDERIVIRDEGQIRWLSIEEFCEGFTLDASEFTLDIERDNLYALSFDEKTHKAVWSPIRRIFKRQAVRTLEIKTDKARTLRMTADHPVLVCEKTGFKTTSAQGLAVGDRIPILAEASCFRSSYTELDLIELLGQERPDIWVSYEISPDFMPAITVEMRGLISRADTRHSYRETGRYPLSVYLALEKQFSLDRRNARLLLRSGKANYIPAIINIDEDFARLLGYYLAEGCTSANGTTDKIIWVFGNNENDREYVEDLCRILDRYQLNYSVRENENTKSIWLSSWFLGTLFRNVLKVGANSHVKAIPEIITIQPPKIIIELLKGLLRGDGSIIFYPPENGSRMRMCWATVSRQLFEQVLFHFQAIGIAPSIYVKPERESMINGKAFTCQPAYYLEFRDYHSIQKIKSFFSSGINERIERELSCYNGSRYSFPRHQQHNGYMSLKVTQIREIVEPVSVYDLEIEGTHNFITSGGIITHNCMGVPTIGGEVRFADGYSRNPLVNAFTLGIVSHDYIFYGKASGVGNPVIYVGAKTGRDGIHGATMASEEFDEASEAKRPTVQVGDPFLEKLLLEACLEAMRAGAIVGIQDMGAAGLTSSSCEMGARSETGVEIDVDLVPQRETGMSAYEMMLSESQERMLIVARAGHEREVIEIFKKWELDAVVIGRVTDDQMLRVKQGGKVVAEIPNTALTDEAPKYHRPIKKPENTGEITSLEQTEKSAEELDATFMKIIASSNVASKEWVYRQYDHMVRTNTVVMPGSDAAVLRVKEKRCGLAMTLDSNARYAAADPREGAKLVIAEACRNLVVSGARPLALTNCLNFASPERPEVMWQFSETVDGMREACEAFNTPVTGGNVSFYNETEGRGIHPTPVIGMVGKVYDMRNVTMQWFKSPDCAIVLLGKTENDLGVSEYAMATRGAADGRVPQIDLDLEKRVQEACLKAITEGLIKSAHDPSDGGLATAIAESCFSSYRREAVGCEVNLEGELSQAALLFAETPSRIVLSCAQEHVERLLAIANEQNISATVIGRTGGKALKISVNGEPVINRTVAEVESIWRAVLPQSLETASMIAAEQR